MERPDKTIYAVAFKHILQLGDDYTLAKTLTSQIKEPSYVDAVWKFLDFDPAIYFAANENEVAEEQQFTQAAPKLKSKIQRCVQPLDGAKGADAERDQCTAGLGLYSDYARELDEIKKLTLRESLERTPKDTVYHYYVSLYQSQRFVLCKGCKSDVLFNAKFEAGNLFQAFRIAGTNHFELYLFPDYDTIQGCAYFLFEIQYKQRNIPLQFRINNMPKVRFPNGWRPLVCAGGVWRRLDSCAYNVSASSNLKTAEYYQMTLNENRNTITEKVPKSQKKVSIDKSANCLVFNYQSTEEVALLASNYPYPFSRLISYLNELREFKFVRISKIGTTECFNYIPCIEIRRSTTSKKLLVLTARVHAQDTAGSFALEGFVDFILGRKNAEMREKLDAIKDELEHRRYEHFLRQMMYFQSVMLEHFTVVVFPFVNIDGAVLGNATLDGEKHDLRQMADYSQEKLPRPIAAVLAKLHEFTDTGMQLSHFFDFSDSLTRPGVSLQTFEMLSNQRMTQLFWQAAGSAGFLPFVDSAQTLGAYFLDATVPRAEAESVQADKLISDFYDMQEPIAAVLSELEAKITRQNALAEFVLPSIIFATSKDIMHDYAIGPESLSICADKSTLLGHVRHEFSVPFAFSCIIGQYYECGQSMARANSTNDNKNDVSCARYFDMNDYCSVGVAIASAVARQVKMNSELHGLIYGEMRSQYLKWLGGSLAQALTRQRTLSLLRIASIPPSCQTLMRFKLYALACPNDTSRADARLDKITKAVRLDLVFDLDEAMRQLTDSDAEIEDAVQLDAAQVQEDREVVKALIQARYPLPDKKKKKGSGRKTTRK